MLLKHLPGCVFFFARNHHHKEVIAASSKLRAASSLSHPSFFTEFHPPKSVGKRKATETTTFGDEGGVIIASTRGPSDE